MIRLPHCTPCSYDASITIINRNSYDVLGWQASFSWAGLPHTSWVAVLCSAHAVKLERHRLQVTFSFSGNFTWGPDANVVRTGNMVTMTPKWTSVSGGGRAGWDPGSYGLWSHAHGFTFCTHHAICCEQTIRAGANLSIGFGGAGSQPSNFIFTQLLPPINSCNDPSLKTRGTFGSKVRLLASLLVAAGTLWYSH